MAQNVPESKTLELPQGVVVIAGPLASGKSELAAELAETADAVVVSHREAFQQAKEASPGANTWTLTSKAMEVCMKQAQTAIANGQSLVLETSFNDLLGIDAMLRVLQKYGGDGMDISLVKLVDEYDRQLERAKSKPNGGYPVQLVNASNLRFDKVLNTCFSDKHKLARELSYGRACGDTRRLAFAKKSVKNQM